MGEFKALSDTVLKIWAAGALITAISWVILYSVFQAAGSDEVSFVIILSTGVLVVLSILFIGNYLKKQL